ncbi:hypothetical protein P3T18_001057 [Paraburkholderia sp. GAS199]|uniref:type VI secretion protein n=1 Tax=Paraburkholderia sp. GAS199 TaxID=3035126 RepID=UPI003D1F6FC5
MKKIFARLALLAGLTLCATQSAFAQLTVIDPTNLIQNTITALKAVKTEAYQDSNIAYQYKMMANQMLQAVGIDPAAMKTQYDQIKSDSQVYTELISTAGDLYGDLNNGAQWASHVQTLISRSGKSNSQWFADMATLYNQRDNQATQLLQTGNNVIQHIQVHAKRRQELQDQVQLSPTAQSTAEVTTHYLDIVSSQMSDMLQMAAGKAQKDAQKESTDNAEDKTRSANAKAFLDQQAAERAAYGN